MQRLAARKSLVTLLGVLLGLVASREANAQSQSLFGNQSLGGRGGTSNSLFNNSSSARGGQNSSVMGSGFLQTTTLGQMSSLMNQGFVGGNNNNGFVGRSATGQSNNQGRNFRQQSFGQNFGGNRGRGNRNSRNSDFDDSNENTNSVSATRMQIRPRHEVAFEYPQPAATELAGSLRTRLSDIAIRRPEFAGVVVDIEGTSGEVTLRGNVASERGAKLAEAMLRQEPGVRTVRNELTVATTPTPPAPASP